VYSRFSKEQEEYVDIVQRALRDRKEVEKETERLWRDTKKREAWCEKIKPMLKSDPYQEFLNVPIMSILISCQDIGEKTAGWLQNCFTQLSDSDYGNLNSLIQKLIEVFWEGVFSKDFTSFLSIPHYTDSAFEEARKKPSVEYKRSVANAIACMNQSGDGVDPGEQLTLFQEQLLPILEDLFQAYRDEEPDIADLQPDWNDLPELDYIQFPDDYNFRVILWRLAFELFTGEHEFLQEQAGNVTDDGATIILGPLVEIGSDEVGDPIFQWYL